MFSHGYLTKGASRLLDGELSRDQTGDHLHLLPAEVVDLAAAGGLRNACVHFSWLSDCGCDVTSYYRCLLS